MSLKQFYTESSQIPTEFAEHYALKDGKYELQIEGVNSISGVLAKNTELLAKNATLTRAKEDAETARAEAEAKADEYRTKPNIPKGQRLVSIEDYEIAEVAKANGLTKEKIPEYVTSGEKLAAIEMERINEKVSDAIGKDRAAWLDHSRANNLRYETRKETVDGKEQEYFVIVGEGGETRVSDYAKEKAAHVKDAENSQQPPQGKQWGKQDSGHNNKPRDLVEQEYNAAIATGRYSL